MKKLLIAAFAAIVMTTSPAIAQQQVQVTVENLQPGDGFYFTPVWFGFHDGGFDLFNEGSAASASLEALAEGGDVAGLNTDFGAAGYTNTTTLTSPGGFAGAPVFDPGESQSTTISLAATDRFASFATMIIPSNDSFFGNDSSTSFELLDAGGIYNGDFSVTLTLADLWDAGTEVNDGQGAAFSANGGTSTDQGGVVTRGPDLSNFNGTDTAAGTTINFANANASPAIRISFTAVPEPTSASILALGTIGMVLRRRRK